MASVLQCLANVPKLRDYFKSEEYLPDINEDNVLGTGGQMANAFHYLLEQMWNGKNKAVKPSRVKVGDNIFYHFFSFGLGCCWRTSSSISRI